MTERLHFHFSLSHIGEGNGNPLQCSCLENPREGGAWWAALQGVAQSQTRLKQLTAAWSKTIKNSLSPAEFSFWHSRPFIYNPVCVSELIFQVSSNALCACLPASMILFKLVPLIKYLLLPVLPTKLTYSFFFFLKIYLLLLVLDLPCCVPAFSSCGGVGELLFSCSVRASHCGDFSCEPCALGHLGSVVVTHALSCPAACGASGA